MGEEGQVARMRHFHKKLKAGFICLQAHCPLFPNQQISRRKMVTVPLASLPSPLLPSPPAEAPALLQQVKYVGTYSRTLIFENQKKSRLCSWESVLLAACTFIEGSCKTNPVPGSCCYYENVKAPHPPQTRPGTERLVLKTSMHCTSISKTACTGYS